MHLKSVGVRSCIHEFIEQLLDKFEKGTRCSIGSWRYTDIRLESHRYPQKTVELLWGKSFSASKAAMTIENRNRTCHLPDDGGVQGVGAKHYLPLAARCPSPVSYKINIMIHC